MRDFPEDVEALCKHVVSEAMQAGMYEEWCRLKGYDLPKTPIALEVDRATGALESRASEFLDFFLGEVMPRIQVGGEW